MHVGFGSNSLRPDLGPSSTHAEQPSPPTAKTKRFFSSLLRCKSQSIKAQRHRPDTHPDSLTEMLGLTLILLATIIAKPRDDRNPTIFIDYTQSVIQRRLNTAESNLPPIRRSGVAYTYLRHPVGTWDRLIHANSTQAYKSVAAYTIMQEPPRKVPRNFTINAPHY